MDFILNRTYFLNSTKGLSVQFVKDTPVFVPPPLYREAKELGAEPVEALPEPTVNLKDATPQEPEQRTKDIRDAIEALTLRNRREDFTAGGSPTQKALSEYLGWAPAAKERDIVVANIAKGE